MPAPRAMEWCGIILCRVRDARYSINPARNAVNVWGGDNTTCNMRASGTLLNARCPVPEPVEGTRGSTIPYSLNPIP